MALEFPGRRYVVASVIGVLVPDGVDEEERACVNAGRKATQDCEICEAVTGRGLRTPSRKLLEKVCYAHAAQGKEGGLTFGGNEISPTRVAR